MKTLAILSQKGGVGKTTLATCLAVAAEADGKTAAIFDLDPQATASFWRDVREAETPAVESIQAVRLSAMLKAAEGAGAELAIIDGAAVARDVAYEAAKVADYVLIPTKAAVFDTMSMMQTIELVRQVDTPFSVVLTFVPPQGQETSDAMAMAGKLAAAICPVTIGNRKSYFRAQGEGLAVQEYEPDGKAAREIERLFQYTCAHLYDKGLKDNAKAQSKRAASGS